MSTHTIELNMRLDVLGHDNSIQAINERETRALAALGTCVHHRADFLMNGVMVPRLVAGIDADGWGADELHLLATQLHQDCIAVFYPAQGRGELVGPGTAAWGAFDLAQFQRVDTDWAMAEALGFAWGKDDMMQFNEEAWAKKEARTGEEIRALVMEIPDDYMHPDSLLASSMKSESTPTPGQDFSGLNAQSDSG